MQETSEVLQHDWRNRPSALDFGSRAKADAFVRGIYFLFPFAGFSFVSVVFSRGAMHVSALLTIDASHAPSIRQRSEILGVCAQAHKLNP